ncbi:MAG TPA: BatA and WFA domain-containing protein [Ktedonobacteraceae bacterium]|nr:BatA and WFA domain-containing protein [Ktedonobacteraceae bacterium]
MNLLVPAALAFSVIIPIILLLYFMRPKRQERVVGSTLLWQQALQDLQASRPWQRLRFTPLLLLQLLAAIIIVLVLARPAVFASSPISGDSIIILQTSASMQATDVTPNRFEAAKSQIASLIDSIGPGDRLSLITMARTPQVLIADSQDQSQLQAALQRATVTNQDADLEQALSLATSLAAGHSNVNVVIVGDGHVLTPDQQLEVPFHVEYLRVGTDAPNVALLSLASRVVNGSLVALAQVANYSHSQRSVPVELYANSKLIGVQTAVLAPGATGSLQWGPLPPTTRFLHAQIVSQDAMTVDHSAWAIVGGSLHGRVLLVTKGNKFLEAALGLQSNIDLYETTPDKYVDTGTFDLTIFDGFVPATLPGSDIFFINPPSGSYLFGKSGQQVAVNHISSGNDSQNILQNVDLSDIHVLRSSHVLTPALWAQPIIVTSQTPLLIAGENQNRRIAALGFDLHDSDFPLQPDFPIFMYNLVNWFLPPPVSGDGQVAPATPVTVQTWPGADQVTIAAPNSQSVTVGPPFPVIPFNQTNTPGIYSVVQRVHGQQRYGAFAVNLFDPLQSRLAPASTLPIANSTSFTSGDTNATPRVLREIWPWIAAILLLVLCAEWWLFSRNYRQQPTLATGHRGTGKHVGVPLVGTRLPGTRNGTGAIATLQNELNSRYRVAKKRFTRATRRMRKNSARKQGKGNRHVNV